MIDLRRETRPLLFLILCLALYAAGASAQQPALEIAPAESSDGTARLSWQVKNDHAVVIEQSRKADFSDAKRLYRGTDSASVITGLGNGEYFFRAQFADARDGSGWSNPVRLVVEHHPLSRAFLFFFLGVVVFLATVVLIVAGGRRAEGGGA
jgi:hypothetical protein